MQLDFTYFLTYTISIISQLTNWLSAGRLNAIDEKELLNLFTDMVRSHTAYMDRSLSVLNLSNGQGGVISALGRNGALTQNELAKFRQVTPATISIMIDRMERDGLVARSSERANSRSNKVILTDKGQELYKKLDELMNVESQTVFSSLTDEERRQAENIFHKLINSVSV